MTVPAGGDLYTVSWGRVLRGLRAGGPLEFLERTARLSQGALVRLELGPFRPLVVTHPDHVRHVLCDRATRYRRGTAMWKALSRLTGTGIAGEGPAWQVSRALWCRGLAGVSAQASTDGLGPWVACAVADLEQRVVAGQSVVDAETEMTRIVHRVINPVLFGSRIPQFQGDRLAAAVSVAFDSVLWRMAVPGLPSVVPVPGDREFRRATRTVKGILLPLVRRIRHEGGGGADLVSLLVDGTDGDGRRLTDEQVAQDIVALFVAGSESSALTLTWAWAALARHPEVAARVRAEADDALGSGPVRHAASRKLPYTRQVLAEVCRLYAVAWAVPRTAAAEDVIDGVRIPAGATVVLSPYLTHRLPEFWERPLRFDPGRFTKEGVRGRHPQAYLPFGDGPHQCVGQSFFLHEAALIIATMAHRFDITAMGRAEPRAAVALRPRHRVALRLTPRR
ncbi:cytochrome P450 [Streptomyces sp. p1417]|uniref:Cytochrome P450 n=1 Tax=Streptomyces typhae TaxID=2681492 RepID=A0A6L6WTZ4_9ACTN|nr:cytochrome P450 [Streptomyces typhae]MVO84968.1 cytochrome P450 [Streptomyces typhae]